MADKQAQLAVGGKTVTLPVLEGTTGPDVVDMQHLLRLLPGHLGRSLAAHEERSS